jgi:D-alanyl-D-alanine dipeptidase
MKLRTICPRVFSTSTLRLIFPVVVLCCITAGQSSLANSTQPAKPAPAPLRWRGLIGEYGVDGNILYILERDGQLCASFKRETSKVLQEVSRNVFTLAENGSGSTQRLVFVRAGTNRAIQVSVNDIVYKRRQIEPEAGATQLRVKAVRPISVLLREALLDQPPSETGERRKSELTELTKLDRTIKLDVRYASTNNLFGTVFYSQARAFLQRPAAEALARVNTKLKSKGYGLLVHDAYRPWYVTKVFWEATPQDKKIFVADPSKGSRHNRGAAVDLTLYDLRTRKPVEMVGTYDETTDRSYPDYPGGTSLQRWHRDLLRSAMEAEGFTVYEAEWWHFDFNDWQLYPIMNTRFEGL